MSYVPSRLKRTRRLSRRLSWWDLGNGAALAMLGAWCIAQRLNVS